MLYKQYENYAAREPNLEELPEEIHDQFSKIEQLSYPLKAELHRKYDYHENGYLINKNTGKVYGDSPIKNNYYVVGKYALHKMIFIYHSPFPSFPEHVLYINRTEFLKKLFNDDWFNQEILNNHLNTPGRDDCEFIYQFFLPHTERKYFISEYLTRLPTFIDHKSKFEVIKQYLETGSYSKHLIIDHIDRNKKNNKINNLRILDRSNNFLNSDLADENRKNYLARFTKAPASQ